MAIVETALGDDVTWVMSGQNESSFTYSMEIHCGNQKLVRPIKLMGIDYVRDYVRGMADVIIVECMVISEDYDLYIFPNRDQSLITLTKSPLGVISDAIQLDKGVASKTYRSTLVNPKSRILTQGKGFVSPTDQYTSTGMKHVKFQLIDLAVEQLMLTSVGGIYRKTTPAKVLYSALTSYSRALTLDDADAVKGVDMPDADNQTPKQQIPVPHGTPLKKLADWLQDEGGGIYDTGIGCYYHANQWYVYPIYDVTRFRKTKRTMTVLVIKSADIPATENTWRVDGDSVTVIANGAINHTDQTDHKAVNEGNGARFVKATELMNGFTPGKTGDAVANSSNVVVTYQAQERDSKMVSAPFSSNRITDNSSREFSKSAMRNGQIIQTNWDRADASLLYPGMPVRVLYESDNLLYEFEGTLLNCQLQVRLATPGMTTVRYITGAALTMFVSVTRTAPAK